MPPSCGGEAGYSLLQSRTSFGNSRPNTMGSAWAEASRRPLGSSFRACSSTELPFLPNGFSMGDSCASTARCLPSICRSDASTSPRKAISSSNSNITQISIGDYVVDVCNGRKALVLAVSKTHCKVRFEADALAGWCVDADVEMKPEIVPVDRLHLWSERWEGQERPRSQNPNLKAGFTTSAAYGIVHDSSSCKVAQPNAQALPAVLVCRASQHAVVPKPPQRRVLPLTPRTTKVFGDMDDAECSLERSWRDERSATLSSEINGECGFQDEGEILLNHFKVVAKARFGGSLGAAWHAVLDVRGTGKVGYLDLVRGARVLGFSGNFRKLWDALTKHGTSEDSGLVSFEMLDPVGAKMLNDFRSLFLSKGLETLDDVWEKYLDLDGSGRCLREEFVIIMTGLGWSKSVANKLFRMLDAGGQQDISLDELEIIGLPRRPVVRNPTGQELLRIRDEQVRERVLLDFHGYLINNFGCVVRGWRLGLDVAGEGKLRFNEFCHAVKDIGFRGPLQTLWRGLDKKRVGYIELSDVDSEAKYQIDEFRDFLEETYFTLEDVWERVFHSDRSGQCSLENFVRVCRSPLNWPGNARRMFKWLDLHGRNALTLDQIDFIGMRRRVVNLSPSARKRILERQANDRVEAGAVLMRFKDFLNQWYGNIVRAWHQEINPTGDKQVEYTEFCVTCRRIRFHGNLKALWLSLDPGETGYIRLADLDPRAAEHLDEFSLLFGTFFPNLDVGWYLCFDSDLSGQCLFDKFRKACAELGVRGNVHELFQYLDLFGEGFLELDMLKILGLCRASSCQAAMMSAKEAATKDLANLQIVLKERHGSLVIAWRRCFCTCSVQGQLFRRIRIDDFISRCRSIGFEGNFPRIWSELVLRNTSFSDLQMLSLDYKPELDDHIVISDSSPRSSCSRGCACVSSRARDSDKSARYQKGQSAASLESPSEEDRPPPSTAVGDSSACARKTEDVDDCSDFGSLLAPEAFEKSSERDHVTDRQLNISRSVAIDDPDKKEQVKRLPLEALGYVTLRAFDPEAFNEILSFRSLCAMKFGSLEDTWRALLKECVQTNVNARLRKVEFCQALHMIGFTGDAQIIFAACDLEQENQISAGHLEFLQIGLR